MILLIELPLLAMVAAEPFSAGTDTRAVLWNRSAGGIIDRGVRVPSEEFTPERLVAICEEFIRSSQATVANLTVVPPGQSIVFFQPSHNTYSGWLRNYKRALNVSVRVAQLTVIRGNAVLRVRDGHTIWRRVVAGSDPLFYRVGGDTFEILHAVLSPAVVYPFVVYARCWGQLSLPKAEAFYEELRKLLPSNVYIRIRMDPWFYDCLWFPQAYWYDLAEPPAEPEKVISAIQLDCVGGESAGECVIARGQSQ